MHLIDGMSPEEVRGRFDRAVAYWNEERFYEAHEDWEELWHGAEGDHRLWLQGLIQYAAALVHYARGFHARGFHVLMGQATEKVAGYSGPTHSLDWPRLYADLEPWREHGRRVASGEAELVHGAPEVPKVHPAEGHTFAPLPLEAD